MQNINDDIYLEKILEQAYYHQPLKKEEIVFLLGQRYQHAMNRIFEMARILRSRYFGEKIFLYGFVYFSTYCQNNCAFCLYRKSNHLLNRYRKSKEEILETACSLAASGVHLLDLTMGEDPAYLSDDGCPDKLLEIADLVKKETGLPLMISPGVVSEDALREFNNHGISWYACYQETHNRELYRRLRTGQGYDERLSKKRIARKFGILIEEGILTGVGDTIEDVADSLMVMDKLGAEQVRVMSFVPQDMTPMHGGETPARHRELLIIAVMRLLFPDRLIPASLDVDGISGLQQRLDAGANVITSIIPPQSGMAGVSNASLDIADGNRTVKRVAEVLEKLKLAPADKTEYSRWIYNRQQILWEENLRKHSILQEISAYGDTQRLQFQHVLSRI